MSQAHSDLPESIVTPTTSLPSAQIEAAVQKLFEGTTDALSPEQLHEKIRDTEGEYVTFAELRRSLWSLVRRGVLEITPDWKITRHAG